jgi:hypothetical protein
MAGRQWFTKLLAIVLLFVLSVPVSHAAPVLTSVDPQPLATYSISGTLDTNWMHQYGQYYETRGSKMTIRITWNPSTSSVRFGLCTSLSSCSWTGTYTGGVGSHTFTVPRSGNYSLAIWNTGPEAISYSGSIDV